MEGKEIQKSKQHATKLKVREYRLKFYTFNRDFVDALLKEVKGIYHEALTTSPELRYALPIYSIRYDDDRLLRTFDSEEFSRKFYTANDIKDVSIEFNKDLRNSLKKLEIVASRSHKAEDLNYQQYNNLISIGGDDSTWVGGAFDRIQALTKKYANTNKWCYSEGFKLSLQLIAVLFCATASLFLSRSLTPFFEFENASVYLFIIFILLLSNLWTYASVRLYNAICMFNPIIGITNKEQSKKGEYIFYGIVASIFAAAIIYLIGFIPKLLK
ncbi:MAG: hypothetical protein GY800_13215 [Planctomycetes bacterium]|nr:hypothetical protein [Planctomycetota bacterium]